MARPKKKQGPLPEIKYGRQMVMTPLVGKHLASRYWKGRLLEDGMTVGDLVVLSMVEQAVEEGNMTAAKYLCDRVDGAPVVLQDYSQEELEKMSDDEIDRILKIGRN